MQSVRQFSPFHLGISLAATWTWPMAIVVSLTLMHDKGLVPYIIWGICNCLAIPFGGWLAYKAPGWWRAAHQKVYRFVMGFYLWPITWLNMQGLYEITLRTGLIEADLLRILVIIVAVSIVVAIFFGGFYLSVITDIGQWAMIMAIMPIALALSILNQSDPAPALYAGWNNALVWGVWLGITTLVGPAIGAELMQRVAHSNSMKPMWIGGAAFTVYLTFAGITVALSMSIGAIILFTLLVLFCAMSTLDSIASAHRYVTGSKVWSLGIGLIAAATWPLVSSLGILAIWAYAGLVVVPFVFGTVIYAYVTSHKLPEAERYFLGAALAREYEDVSPTGVKDGEIVASETA